MSIPLLVRHFKINSNLKNQKITDGKSDLKIDLVFFVFSFIFMMVLIYPFVYGESLFAKLLDSQFVESAPSKPINGNYEKKVITEIGGKIHTITVKLQITPLKPTISSY